MDNAVAVDVQELRSRMAGTVVAPQDAAWDEARAAWNLSVDQRPALVAVPESVADVVAIVEFARERGLRVAPQGTGHNAGAIATLERTILVKTTALRSVEIDAPGRRARVGAGVLWAEVTGPASTASRRSRARRPTSASSATRSAAASAGCRAGTASPPTA